MAKVVALQAKNVMLDRYANIGGPPAHPQAMSVDDSTDAFGPSTTTLGSPANLAAAGFDSVTRSGQTLTFVATFATGVANFIHKRICVHNAAPGAVTGVSATFQFGHDQQSIQKNNQTQLTYTVQLVQG